MKEIEEAIQDGVDKLNEHKHKGDCEFSCTLGVKKALRACAEAMLKKIEEENLDDYFAYQEGLKRGEAKGERKALQFVEKHKLESYKRGEAKGYNRACDDKEAVDKALDEAYAKGRADALKELRKDLLIEKKSYTQNKKLEGGPWDSALDWVLSWLNAKDTEKE